MGPGDVGDVRWMGQRNPKHQLKTVGNLSHDFVGVSTILLVVQDFATMHSIYHKPISLPSEQKPIKHTTLGTPYLLLKPMLFTGEVQFSPVSTS